LKFLFSLAAHILNGKTITDFNQILLFFQDIDNEQNSQKIRYYSRKDIKITIERAMLLILLDQ